MKRGINKSSQLAKLSPRKTSGEKKCKLKAGEDNKALRLRAKLARERKAWDVVGVG